MGISQAGVSEKNPYAALGVRDCTLPLLLQTLALILAAQSAAHLRTPALVCLLANALISWPSICLWLDEPEHGTGDRTLRACFLGTVIRHVYEMAAKLLLYHREPWARRGPSSKLSTVGLSPGTEENHCRAQTWSHFNWLYKMDLFESNSRQHLPVELY